MYCNVNQYEKIIRNNQLIIELKFLAIQVSPNIHGDKYLLSNLLKIIDYYQEYERK